MNLCSDFQFAQKIVDTIDLLVVSTKPEKYPGLSGVVDHMVCCPSLIEHVYALKYEIGLELSSVCLFRRIGAMSWVLPIRRHHMSISRHGFTCNFAMTNILNHNENIAILLVLEHSMAT